MFQSSRAQLSEKYNNAFHEIRSLGLSHSASEKLAKLLLEWSSKNGEAAKQEPGVKLALTHEEIAQMTGTSRETIGPTEMTMPGSTGIELKQQGVGQPMGHPGGHPSDLNAMTKGCLAGTGVCFLSHEGEVYPCGDLPVIAADLRKQSFRDIWENSTVFHELRDTSGLKGRCGCCEFRNVCTGCRARAYAATGDFMDEEPFCV